MVNFDWECKIKKALLFALALQLPSFVLAATPSIEEGNPKWYQADLIVFRYLDKDSGEAWPPVKQHPMRTDVISLKPNTPVKREPLSGNLLEPTQPEQAVIPPDLVRDSFISLPRDDFLLNKTSERLNRSSRYEVISQVAWRMPIDDELKEQPVKIQASSANGYRFLLSGSVTVSNSRYLHLDADLWLNELAPEALFSEITGQSKVNDFRDIAEKGQRSGSMIRLNAQDTPLRITRNFQLKEKRRLKKLDEIQYLDSPVFGVLFKLTPYDRPATILKISTHNKAIYDNDLALTSTLTP